MKTISARSRKVESLLSEATDLLEDGYEVVFSMPATTSPERILKIMDAVVSSHRVKIVVKSTSLLEVLELGTAGAVIGAAGFTVALISTAIAAGAPVTVPMVLTTAGVGAVTGLIVGSGVALISEMHVYRYRGEIRIKLLPA